MNFSDNVVLITHYLNYIYAYIKLRKCSTNSVCTVVHQLKYCFTDVILS
jgi:hypothetical protein